MSRRYTPTYVNTPALLEEVGGLANLFDILVKADPKLSKSTVWQWKNRGVPAHVFTQLLALHLSGIIKLDYKKCIDTGALPEELIDLVGARA